MRSRDLRLRCNNQTLKDFMPIIPLEHTLYFKRSKSMNGHIVTPKTRNKISIANTGKIRTEQTKLKLSLLNIGKKLSPETCQKMSESRMGRNVSPETREKCRLGNLGKKRSIQTRERILLSNRRKANDPKILEKIRNARLKQIMPYRDTKPERMMHIALSLHRIKFEKHKAVLGQPDIFIKPNICVFIDGDYWHANPQKFDDNFQIFKNPKTVTARDIRLKDFSINHRLNSHGFQVIRVWESEIKKDANRCAYNIINLIKQNLNNSILNQEGNLLKGD